jgi:hypothetical protein
MIELLVGIERPFCDHTSEIANIGILWLTYQAKVPPGLKIWCRVCDKKLIIRQGENLPTIIRIAQNPDQGEQAEGERRYAEPAPTKPPGSLNEPFVIPHSREITDKDRLFLKALRIKCDD